MDVTMGASDGPITAASGSDTMRISINYSGFTASFNHAFSQMTIDNLFNGEVEVKTAPKDKGNKCPLTKVSHATSMPHCHFKITNAHKSSLDCPQTCRNGQYSLCHCPRHGY